MCMMSRDVRIQWVPQSSSTWNSFPPGLPGTGLIRSTLTRSGLTGHSSLTWPAPLRTFCV
jgi:hypothetical protein